MPYLNCPRCRLVVRTAVADTAHDCPRCAARLSTRPKRLFLGDLPRNAVPTALIAELRRERPGVGAGKHHRSTA